MTQNHIQAKIKNLKYLTNSIIQETRDPLFMIKKTCEIARSNLDQTIELLYSISDCASHSILAIDIALQNSSIEKIDKSKFVDLSIANVVDEAIGKYFFKNKKEIELLNVDLANDFIFKGDENLMSFVVLNLLKNSLVQKAKINIWFDADKRCFYFKDKLEYIFNERKPNFQNPTSTEIGLSFCKRVMRAFGGDIFVKSGVGIGTEFCLWFTI